MLKCPFQTDDVFFVLRISLSQLIENLNLLQASAIPEETNVRETAKSDDKEPTWTPDTLLSLLRLPYPGRHRRLARYVHGRHSQTCLSPEKKTLDSGRRLIVHRESRYNILLSQQRSQVWW